MTISEARALCGVFGEIYANGTIYPKWLSGKITDVDRTMIEFTDNNNFIHLFKMAKVVYFHPKVIRKISWKMPKKFIQ
jgi:hypothetical protein